jgi:hypothetical protein
MGADTPDPLRRSDPTCQHHWSPVMSCDFCDAHDPIDIDASCARHAALVAAARRLLRYSGNALMTEAEQEDWIALRAALEGEPS